MRFLIIMTLLYWAPTLFYIGKTLLPGRKFYEHRVMDVLCNNFLACMLTPWFMAWYYATRE